MKSIPSLSFLIRRFLLFQVAAVLLTIDFHERVLQDKRAFLAKADNSNGGSIVGQGHSSGANAGGFNYEIEKRVHERVSELMNVPVTMLGLVEQYSQTDVFEPPFLRPHQKDEIFRFLWTVWKEFNIDLYYGQEDGLFLGVIKGSGTYQEGRGTNGYLLGDGRSEEDAYFQRLYYDKCLDRDNGAPQNCTLKASEDYVSCVDNCKLTPCPSSIPTATTRNSLVSAEHAVGTSSNPVIYCPTYDILQVPDNEDISMGYIPRYYYCLSKAGGFIENDPPNSVASPASMIFGLCSHSDRVTLVDGKTDTKETYAMADRRNYLFLGDYYDEYSTEEEASAVPSALYSNDPLAIDDSQKSDQVFVGGHHSRRYEPRLRPWYIGTRDIQDAFWTKPYPFATNNDMGISYGKPLYYTDPSTGHKVFRGVICVDYDLEVISKFLREVFLEMGLIEERENDSLLYSSSSGATVLIVEDDDHNYIIGSSTGSKAAKKVRVDDESINCEDEEIFSGEVECKTVRATPGDYAQNYDAPLDRIMAFAFEEQKKAGFPKELVVSENPNKIHSNDTAADFYVSQSLDYEQSEGENLKWKIIVAMPVPVASNDELYYGDPIFVVVLAVGVTGCAACLTLFYYYFKRRKRTEVRMSDWRFTSAFILGCAVLNLTTLTYFGPASDETCMLRMWSFHFVFVLTLAPLLVKVWRIYKLVGSADRAIRLSITNRDAFLYTMPAILLQALILTLFSIFDPSKAYTYVDIDGSSSYQHTMCKHDTVAFAVTQLIFEGGLVLTGCVLAWKTRNLGSTLGEAKQLLFAMYNVGLVALIVLLMGSFLRIDQKSVYVVMTVGIFWSTVFSSCAFVLPRLLQIQRNTVRRRPCSVNRPSSYYNSTNGISTSFRGSLSTSFNRGINRPGSNSFTAPQEQPPMFLGGSMYAEPRSKVPSSVNSSDYNVELACQTSHSEPWNVPRKPSLDIDKQSSFYSSSGSIDMGDMPGDSDREDEHDDDDSQASDRQEHRNTSFTKISISPSESELLQELGKSIESCVIKEEDIEASIVFESAVDDDDNTDDDSDC
eukprot:CAMPEP_0116141262 /NCGR_PEP_ID=MMETSP0329-20121206/14287_1 /TAXON_ID=697910 /ORGANISM="Pseudo-nitzschia arenysensis, Strain B593" /LENGTH=1057 /DNA_ID=CAMNT_0003636431 /DNA_START=252 /DNA_END=3425 /DNA_ORIENTATION=-